VRRPGAGLRKLRCGYPWTIDGVEAPANAIVSCLQDGCDLAHTDCSCCSANETPTAGLRRENSPFCHQATARTGGARHRITRVQSLCRGACVTNLHCCQQLAALWGDHHRDDISCRHEVSWWHGRVDDRGRVFEVSRGQHGTER